MIQRIVLSLFLILGAAGLTAGTVEARHDVYATTYLGNNWYVDQDSVKKIGDVVSFTVYTTIGLEYRVNGGSEYYNADAYYGGQKLGSINGQSIYKSPGMMAAMRVARR